MLDSKRAKYFAFLSLTFVVQVFSYMYQFHTFIYWNFFLHFPLSILLLIPMKHTKWIHFLLRDRPSESWRSLLKTIKNIVLFKTEPTTICIIQQGNNKLSVRKSQKLRNLRNLGSKIWFSFTSLYELQRFIFFVFFSSILINLPLYIKLFCCCLWWFFNSSWECSQSLKREFGAQKAIFAIVLVITIIVIRLIVLFI